MLVNQTQTHVIAACCDNVMLLQQFVPSICQISGECIFQRVSCPGAQAINFLVNHFAKCSLI